MKTTIYADRQFTVGDVDPRLFGSFVEHMGRVIYTGIYQPDHPKADEEGCRTDVIEAVKDMGVKTMRYPGGNYSSGYRWEDGVGPKSERPHRLDLAWRSVETNQFGTHEFMSWAKKVGVKPIFTVNLGTRGIQEAVQYLEYCNFPAGTALSDKRRANGAEEPFAVKTWCLGNELDGEWQIGHKTAYEYGRLAAETGKAMKAVDPSIELIVCGSSLASMDSCPKWDLDVLMETYGIADYLALHQYYAGQEKGTEGFLAQSQEFDQHIQTIKSVLEVVRKMKGSHKQMKLSVDEWGVWAKPSDTVNQEVDQKPWQIAPAISEQIYTFEDTLLFAGMQMAILRNCDAISIACQSLITNISACIMTEKDGGVWYQPNYYVFRMLSKYGQGTVLQTKTTGDSYHTESAGDVPYLDQLLVWNQEAKEAALFLVNRADETMEISGSAAGLTFKTVIEAQALNSDDLKATNEKDHDRIKPTVLRDAEVHEAGYRVKLPAYTFAMVRFQVDEDESVDVVERLRYSMSKD